VFNSSLVRYLFVLSTIAIGFAIVQISPATAGGDDTAYQRADQAKAVQRADTFNWQHWNVIHSDEQSVCRERNGNFVCLTKSSSRNVNWNVR
jgi:hypothetical protein